MHPSSNLPSLRRSSMTKVKQKLAMKNRTIKSIEATVGSLSAPSKMPCHGFSLPAKDCKVGSKLRLSKKSTCSSCYALKGRYVFPSVQNALQSRLDKLKSLTSDEWADSMTDLVFRKEKSGYFRWHDSGDLQSLAHLEAIAKVAVNLPKIKFWLPTREYKIVKSYVDKHGSFPSNLTVRLSAYFKQSAPPAETASKLDAVCSTVGYTASKWVCPSGKQGNQCLDCRACWNRSVANVDYPLH